MAWLHLERILEHGLSPLQALGVSALGFMLWLFGWRLSRVAVGVLGFALGALIGLKVCRAAALHPGWGVGVGGGLLGLLAWPFFKVGVFLGVGAVAGALAGALVQAAWGRGFLLAFGLAGVLTGALAVWLTRPLVILATALVGAVAWLEGGLSAAAGWALPALAGFPAQHPWAWGVILALACAVGIGVQSHLGPRSPGRAEASAESS